MLESHQRPDALPLKSTRIAFVSIAGFGGVWRSWKIASSLHDAGATITIVGYTGEVPAVFAESGFTILEVERETPDATTSRCHEVPSLAPLISALAVTDPHDVPTPPEWPSSMHQLRIGRAIENRIGRHLSIGPLHRRFTADMAAYTETLRSRYDALVQAQADAAERGRVAAAEYERATAEAIEQVMVDAATMRRWFQAESHSPLADALVSVAPDVIVSIDLGALDTASAAADRLRCKLVYSANEFWAGFLRNPDSPAHPIDAHLALLTESRIAHRADLVIATSHTMASRMRDHLALKAPPLTLVNAPTERVETPGPTHRPLRLVFAGGLSKDRNIDGLIDAVAQLDGAVTLDIHGRDRTTSADELRAQIERLGVAHLVTLHGGYDYANIVSILRDYDVGVGTSLLVEENFEVTLPNKVFDSMCAGLALAMYDAPAIRELYDDAPCGIVLDTTSPSSIAAGLRRLVEDTALVDSLRAESVRASERYWWPSQGSNAVQAFRDMLGIGA